MKPDCIQDNDVCIDLPTLSLNTYEPDLPGFDTVLKLGSKGAPESTQTVALQPEVYISNKVGGGGLGRRPISNLVTSRKKLRTVRIWRTV